MSEENYLVVTFLNGEKWAIPASVILKSRDDYYRKRDEAHGDEFDEEAETKFAFEDDSYELIDWARSSMNWKDVKDTAVRVECSGKTDYDEDWNTGLDMEVVDNIKEIK